ncbi:Sapep family Mn(2+)-dependent dipeptidase [Mycoplasma miroungirhinis]|uniref:Sapep family Mn(2+)-dependent dipeptidase n=1 Tax=Mycoplasma miroungirhinis TaxID=754516 RepID=A0A6M4JE49_9MOLU|nr:Sapep family Mn(2+)-dependent dipeptidase [Mycoplasma miroungirhinis]QJR44356.1 Sapep family Mn(2+)-dependent dipeptidase [Mycoplasma miroungirhinis]
MNNIIKYTQTQEEFKEMVEHIAKLCKIPSVSVTNLENEFPFSKEVDNALNYVLNLSKEFGFKTYKDKKNRYGFCEIGSGKKLIGILCHLDVVPSGDDNQWESAAFEPIIKENEIFGRGTLDDKGPSIITLYAMKYILDNNLIDDNYTIRAIFGLSEETTMESMKFYLKDFGNPDLGYTPDGEWPLVFAEKLIFDYDLKFEQFKDWKLEAGVVYNQIPDSLSIETSEASHLSKLFNEKDIEIINENKFIVKGIAGHGSTPAAGDNAILKFIKTIVKHDKKYLENDFFRFLYLNFQNNDFSMPDIFFNYEDESGTLSSNPAFLRTNNNQFSIGFDMRVPAKKLPEEVNNDLIYYLDENEYEYVFEMVGSKKAKYIASDSELVQTLMNVYKQVTQKFDEKPIAIGGGTYARTFENCVAFGATTKMELMHAPNERFTFEEIKQDLEIYINALKELQKL